MVSEMLIAELKESINSNIVFWVKDFRFEGKLLDCDSEYLKYFDSHKDKVRYVRVSEIGEWEVVSNG